MRIAKKIIHYIAIPFWLLLIPVGAAIGWLKERREQTDQMKLKLDEDGRVLPHSHKCPVCDKLVACNDPYWCNRKKKYCKEHAV